MSERGASTPLPQPHKLVKIKSGVRQAEHLTFLSDGRVAVADSAQGVVAIFDQAGSRDDPLATKVNPVGVTATRSGMVMFVNRLRAKQTGQVHVHTSDGELMSQWPEEPTAWCPHAIAVTNRGQLVVSNVHKVRHSVEVFTADGRPILKFGNKGTGLKEFLNPWYVGVDVFDRIVVSDHSNHCIKLYDDRSHFIACYGSPGSGPGQLRAPRGVCSDKQGNLLVCDSGNKRVSVFSADGRFLQHLLTSQDSALKSPFDISTTSDGNKVAVSQHTGASTGSAFHKIRIYSMNQ